MKRAVWIRVVVLVCLVLISSLPVSTTDRLASEVAVGDCQYRNAVASGRTWCVNIEEYLMHETHPTLPRYGTDCVQAWLLTLEAKPTQMVKAPALNLKDIKGRTFRLADHKGKVVLINFWATWCPPCRAEIPELIKWQQQYRSSGLQIIGITYPPQKLSVVRNFSAKLRINYPLALGTRATKLLFTRSETLPLTIVIDRAGNIVEIIEGILLPEEFENKVKPLLSSSRPSP